MQYMIRCLLYIRYMYPHPKKSPPPKKKKKFIGQPSKHIHEILQKGWKGGGGQFAPHHFHPLFGWNGPKYDLIQLFGHPFWGLDPFWGMFDPSSLLLVIFKLSQRFGWNGAKYDLIWLLRMLWDIFTKFSGMIHLYPRHIGIVFQPDQMSNMATSRNFAEFQMRTWVLYLYFPG